MTRILACLAGLLVSTTLLAWDTRTTPTFPDGTPIDLALPARLHMQNTGGSDGAGLCVYTSVVLAARWQNTREVYDLRKFAEGRPGGSYPEKLANDLKVYANRYNITLPPYLQHTGGDDRLLDLCMATRRMACITYAGKDDFYDSAILHMVNLVHLDQTRGAIQDNNRAGRWTTASRQRILQRWKGLDDNGRDLLVPVRQGLRTIWVPAGGGWVFVWLTPPPPPRPPAASEDRPEKHEHIGYWERVIIEDYAYWLYWVNGELVGGFRDGRFYRIAIQDGQYIVLDPAETPEGLSPPAPEPTDDWNKGVEPWRVDKRNRYWINGVEVSMAKAYAVASDPGEFGDDSDRYHLSIVGCADKQKVLQAAEKYARRLHIQFYTKDDWPAEYLPAPITLQEPAKIGGRVVGVGQCDDDVGKILTDVFDPPPPVKPDPPVAPEPKCECKGSNSLVVVAIVTAAIVLLLVIRRWTPSIR